MKEPDITRLFEQHAPFVRALARQLSGAAADPDDVTQDVFFIAWQKLDDFEGSQFRTWLARITIRVAATARRRAWLRRQLGFESVRQEPVDPQTPERSAELQQAWAIFDSVAARLSDKKRTVLVLAEIHGFTGPEIAEAIDCPLQTVYTRLFHARRDFVAELEAAGHDASHFAKGGLT